jgi:hypothetical protein
LKEAKKKFQLKYFAVIFGKKFSQMTQMRKWLKRSILKTHVLIHWLLSGDSRNLENFICKKICEIFIGHYHKSFSR